MRTKPRRALSSVWLSSVLPLMLCLLFPSRASAFALLGPYADWMVPTNGYAQAGAYQFPGDIGGPMDLSEEYRWNVPVVTYGFDPSFLDYFGSNGVAAVEEAFGVLNALPPAGGMDLTSFPPDPEWDNYRAGAAGLYHLKTVTLAALLEQLGLAQPERYVFALRQFDWKVFDPSFWATSEQSWPPGTIPNYILERNFDPDTLLPSHFVNGLLFTGDVQVYGTPYANVDSASVRTYPVDYDYLLLNPYSPLAQLEFSPGEFYFGLTPDDAGGLRYLLSSNNVNPEILLPDVHGTGTNATSYVNFASRPGVEKITFVRQTYDVAAQAFVPLTNNFIDTYLTNGVALQQQLQRVTTQPDILFCAADTAALDVRAPIYVRTGTSNWWNSATATGTAGNGPGLIRPPIKMTFKKRMYRTVTSESYLTWGIDTSQWGSFDASTNAPVSLPSLAPAPDSPLLLRLQLTPDTNSYQSPIIARYQWQLPLPPGGQANLQFSTNLTSWVTTTPVTNQGFPIDWLHYFSPTGTGFFRVVPQASPTGPTN